MATRSLITLRLLWQLVPLSCAAILPAAPEWSVWRGPAGDGRYDHETGWHHDWPDAGPTVLWRVGVHVGYSGLAVSEGRAYTVGNAAGEDLIQCLDALSGEVQWIARYPQDLVPKYNPGGPNAPPVIEGRWLYIFSKQGLVSCLDKATGTVRWRTDLAAQAAAKMPTWGFSSSPLIVGDRLFLNANQSGIALDKGSGEIVWNSPSASGGYAAAVALTCRAKPALAIFGYDAMHVVSQESGERLWQVAWPTKMGENSADPLVIRDSLYLSSWWGMGGALFDPNLDSDVPIWKNPEFQNHIAAPVLHGGALYGFDGPVHRAAEKGALRCVDDASGETLWSEDGIKGSLILSQDKLIVLTHDGTLIVAKADRHGYEEVARHEGLGKRTWAPPVLHGSRLYIRDADGWAICLDLSVGADRQNQNGG